MNFALALLIYLLFFIFLLWALAKSGVRFFSALVLTLLLSGLILLVLVPPCEIEDQIDLYFSNKPYNKSDNWIVLIYIFIFLLSFILISVYTVLKALQDKKGDKEMIYL